MAASACPPEHDFGPVWLGRAALPPEDRRPAMHRLVKRKDFLAAAAGQRANSGTLLLQGRDRADDDVPRIGLTVTKKHGNAVERNRIRRRLRAAVRDALPRAGKDGFDYVIVARRAALGARFADLIKDIERGISRLHSGSRRPPKTAARDIAAQRPACADGEHLP